MRPVSTPHASGTVVVLRDASALEVLLLQRCARNGEPGAWVFPGGKVDAPDCRSGADPADDARRAAVRETAEEAGIALDADALTAISRWITPEISPKRFDTWFFAALAPAGAQVRVDGAEMIDHRWLAPAAALRAHHEHAIRLAPPTFVTVTWLAEFASAAQALDVLPGRMTDPFRPRIHRVPTGALMLYPGDAGYESGEIEAAGARHRLWAVADPWRYERTQAPRSGARSEPQASEAHKVDI
jgi:8-oxo-dGTP pyrophosphatase MutT (NUDIX family)